MGVMESYYSPQTQITKVSEIMIQTSNKWIISCRIVISNDKFLLLDIHIIDSKYLLSTLF